VAAGRLKKKVAPRTGFAETPIFPPWASTIERLMMDLKVEAEGWLGLLKEHAIRVSCNKIGAMKAEGDAKTNLLAEATQLQEQQTALMVYCSCCSCFQPLPWLIAVTMRRQSGSAVRSCRLRPPGPFPQARRGFCRPHRRWQPPDGHS